MDSVGTSAVTRLPRPPTLEGVARSADSSAVGARDEAVGPLAGGEDDAVTGAAGGVDDGDVDDGDVDDGDVDDSIDDDGGVDEGVDDGSIDGDEVSAAVGRSSPASSSSSPWGNDTWPRERRRTMGAAVVDGLDGVGLDGVGLDGVGLDDVGRRGTNSGYSAGGVDSAEAEGAPGSSGAGRPGGRSTDDVAGGEGRSGWVEAGWGDGAAAVGRTSDVSVNAPGLSPDGASTGASDRDTTSPGTMAGPPPRRRTPVVLSTPGNIEGAISGTAAGSAWSADPTGRSVPTEAGLETRRRTASGVGRVEAGGAGRGLALAFAAMRRGRGAGGGDEGTDCSSMSSSSSEPVMRWSSCGAAGLNWRRARRLTRPATCMSTVWVSSVSATAVGRRVTR